jgi:hypothetical protein
MRKTPKTNRVAVNISLTASEREELQRRALEESTREGKMISVSEYIRRRTLAGYQAAA